MYLTCISKKIFLSHLSNYWFRFTLDSDELILLTNQNQKKSFNRLALKINRMNSQISISLVCLRYVA